MQLKMMIIILIAIMTARRQEREREKERRSLCAPFVCLPPTTLKWSSSVSSTQAERDRKHAQASKVVQSRGEVSLPC